MEKFSCFNWKGKVNIKSPQRILWMIQNWIFKEDGSTQFEQVFFGKEIVKTDRGCFVITR